MRNLSMSFKGNVLDTDVTGDTPSGRSSGVEHNLAKVRVGRSNRLARSIFSKNR